MSFPMTELTYHLTGHALTFAAVCPPPVVLSWGTDLILCNPGMCNDLCVVPWGLIAHTPYLSITFAVVAFWWYHLR